MKKISAITLISALSLNLFAHPGHDHSDMSNGILLDHLVWLIIPAVVFIVAYFLVKKRKSVKQ